MGMTNKPLVPGRVRGKRKKFFSRGIRCRLGAHQGKMFLRRSEHKGILISKDSKDNVNELVHDGTTGHLGQLRFALFLIVTGEDWIEILSIALSGNIGSDRHTQRGSKVF